VRSGKNLVDVSTKFIRGQSVEQIKSVMETQKRLHALEDAGGEGSSAGQDVHETFVPANMPSTRELHLKQHIEELEREIKGKSEFIVSVQRNYSVVAVSLSSVQDEIVHSRALVREWKQRVGDLEQNIVDFDGLKRELISKKKEVEAGVVKAIHDKKSIKMLEDKIKNLQLQMFDLMEQKQALNEELLGNKKELKTKSEGLRALETLHSDQKGAGDEILKAKLRECESELQYAVGALESARADAQESKAVASRAGLELNKLKNIRTRDTLDKENLQNDVSRLRAQLAQKKSEIKASQDVAAGHVEEDGDLSGVSKAELMARLKFAENSGIRIMKVRLAEQQTALDAELKKQLGVLEGKIRRECNSKSTSELEALAKQFQEDTQRSTAVHMAGVAGLASQLAALQDKHDELSNENEGLKLKLSSVQGEATAQQASLLSQASSREKAILELESKHAVNQAQVIALTARLSSVESELDAQSGKFAQEKSVFEQAALSEYGAKLQQLSEQVCIRARACVCVCVYVYVCEVLLMYM
jgi:chromosome segregation ATPase